MKPVLNRIDSELYAEDILINVLKRQRFGFEVRDALADKLESIIVDVVNNRNRVEARKQLKKVTSKTHKVNVD